MASEFPYRAEVHAIASRHGLDPDLVHAVCLVESSGRTDAFRYESGFWLKYLAGKPEYDGAIPRRVSSSYGLMQCMYTTALQFGYPKGDPPEYLFVPVIGIEYGCRTLAHYLKWAKGDVRKALACYNGGPGNWQAAAPQQYADKALFTLAQLRGVG